ncbi:phenylacetate-CoA oxygenase subunit PaaJ [Allosphingosinicella flava]|uniref:Phenylacetate-CoA oxygenase subunit PaaJ n=1 Tax=Allosphingosinicella flava TaxID=2771430 RepID=A0A7T2GK16_9SPHN|nr:1,2-phenylacetyl-CoA epoxidase subunit PaaD [Sphingosinicella flava]QPQ55305.1 phenylacetate-CoA oxygenase subunit PaaJ [Sphingosinicella flava]
MVIVDDHDRSKALPVDGGGLGGGDASGSTPPYVEDHPHPASPIEGEGQIWEVLASVPDPEVPAVSIVDLGIVRDVRPDRVALTPTYTGCPATQVIETMVRIALDKAGFENVQIETTLSPPWTTDWITPEGREKLRAYGISPPVPAGSRAVECPQCGSSHTQEVSRFGSTPCKALWRCRDCLEPFDHFKCH